MAENKNYIALEATSQEIAGTVATLYEIESKLTAEKVGQTNNSGGTAKEGTIFAKLNRIQNLLLGYDGVFQAKCSANSNTLTSSIDKSSTDTESVNTLVNVNGCGILQSIELSHGMGVKVYIDEEKIFDFYARGQSDTAYFGATGGENIHPPINTGLYNDRTYSGYGWKSGLAAPLVFTKSLKVQYYLGVTGESYNATIDVTYGIGGAAQ